MDILFGNNLATNMGSGTFSVGTLSGPLGVAYDVGDVDGDGDLDLWAVDGSGASLRLYLNTFAPIDGLALTDNVASRAYGSTASRRVGVNDALTLTATSMQDTFGIMLGTPGVSEARLQIQSLALGDIDNGARSSDRTARTRSGHRVIL